MAQSVSGGGGESVSAFSLEGQASPKGLREWLTERKAEAKAHGGKPWTKSALAAVARKWRESKDGSLRIANRKSGEIVNPTTGEIVTGCVTIGKLAESLGITTDQATDALERLNLVVRVLDCREVPMICAPAVRKPVYFHTARVTPSGLERGFVIPISIRRDGSLRTLILLTPEGQEFLRANHQSQTENKRAIDKKRDLIADLVRRGHSQAEIVRLTGLPKQTVSRHAKAFRVATASCPISG